jgi:hypothetical protein
MRKIAIFAFKGNPICFIHVLLNALDLHEKGADVKIVLEGEATALVTDLRKIEHPLHKLYAKAKDLALIHTVCRACAVKMGSLQAVEEEGLSLADEMSGHAGMAPYLEKDYEIITL